MATSAADRTLCERISDGHHDAFEALMRKHNGRLFRVARAILKDDAAAEDSLQEAYLQAYRKIGDFRGESNIATWLTRIVVNQALMALRRQKREPVVVPFGTGRDENAEAQMDPVDTHAEPAPDRLVRAEIRRLLEQKIDDLPLALRTVFVMRELDEMSVEETAECLSIPAATVRTRLFRARAQLRQALEHDVDRASMDVFAFAGARCDRIVAGVLAKIGSGNANG
jgi:RNA polymerase sigma-70 factor (ECF subfamily)